MGDPDAIDALIAAVRRSEPGAMDRLIEASYPELRRLAHIHLAQERDGHTLSTTAIVHEAYLRLARGNAAWTDRRHFLRASGMVMRHLLVDYARQRRSGKRGSGAERLTLADDLRAIDDDSLAVIALDDALRELAEVDPRLEQVMECRYFAGLSVAETAEALGMSVRTVERECQRARGYLLQAMNADGA